MFLRALTAVLLSAVAVTAAPAADDTKPAKKARADSAVTCQSESSVGSHIRRRNCVTREQREAKRREGQAAVERQQRRSTPSG